MVWALFVYTYHVAQRFPQSAGTRYGFVDVYHVVEICSEVNVSPMDQGARPLHVVCAAKMYAGRHPKRSRTRDRVLRDVNCYSGPSLMLVNPETLERVFKDRAFVEPLTLIDPEALALLARYVDYFINEAIERANESRIQEQTSDANTRTGNFLTEEHLIKNAGTLVLDF